MDWDAIAAIGQVLGSVAVFITLVYLAVQVRHARSESRRALSQGRAEAIREMMAYTDDARFRSVFMKANAALGNQPMNPVITALVQQAALTDEDAFWLLSHELVWWTYRLQVIPSVDELPGMERTMFDQGIRVNYGRPGVSRVFYEVFIKPTQHPDAVRYIDNLLAQQG